MDRARAALFYPISGRSRAQHEKNGTYRCHFRLLTNPTFL
ncbi:hypothetical protein X949_1430 [Burkholderia pseudomallei MSHR5609]|nr:hypothetical protein X949_1430 [Burkholderia pseudomallei MSHR5609]